MPEALHHTKLCVLRIKKKFISAAATILGVARIVMEANPAFRLATRVGVVEGGVGGLSLRFAPHLAAPLGNNDSSARKLIATAADIQDPLWRLPIWNDSDPWLSNSMAELNIIKTNPCSAAIVAALFLRHFITLETVWGHIDLYAWNDQSRPARSGGAPSWPRSNNFRRRLTETNCNVMYRWSPW
jgi:leucyl aminopeptidase